MILPDKNIKVEYSILGCGVILLNFILEPQTISLLWDKANKYEQLVSYEKFLLTLDFLYAIGTIDINNGMIVRCNNDSFN